MTPQQIFDTVSVGLLTQNRKSVRSRNYCLYRGPKGAKCAAGLLIPDDLYDKVIENTQIGMLLRSECSVSFGVSEKTDRLNEIGKAICDRLQLTPAGISLIAALQSVHDNNPVDIWPVRLAAVAKNHKLNTKAMRAYLKARAANTVN